MTEKEKMFSGYLFNGNYDAELERERNIAIDLCYEYNLLRPSDVNAQQKILRQLLGHIGENVTISAPFYCDYGKNISVGDWFYSNRNVYFTDGVNITIGDHVFIGPNCCLTTAEHAIDAGQRISGMEVAKPIIISNNVWLGANVTVLAGVTIGENSVIGAGSVVKHDIPPNVVAVGIPCKILRNITEKDKFRYPVFDEK